MHLTAASELGPVKFAAWHQYKKAIRGSHLVHRRNNLNELTKLTVGYINNTTIFFSAICFTSWSFISLFSFNPTLIQVSVVNALDMQVVVSTVPPTLVEENKEQLIR